MAKAKTSTKKTTSKKATSAKKAPAKKTAAKKTTTKAATKKTTKKKTKKDVGSEEVVMDRRRADRRESKEVEAAAPEVKVEKRAKVNRRRQIDPTTCERDYNNEEIEFMQALDAYKRSSGRMFPTCSEILEVIRDLGYQKLALSGIPEIKPEEPVAEVADSEESLEEDFAEFSL